MVSKRSVLRHRLREGNVNRLPLPQAQVELVGDAGVLEDARLDALQATDAGIFDDVTRLVLHRSRLSFARHLDERLRVRLVQGLRQRRHLASQQHRFQLDAQRVGHLPAQGQQFVGDVRDLPALRRGG
jgi:hypothetical protein